MTRFAPESMLGLALVAGILVLVAPEIGPVWLAVALYLVCWPARDEAWARRAMIGATALLLFWAIGQLQVVLTPFALALVLAYVLDPSVRRLTALRMPRTAAVLVLLVVMMSSLLLVVTVLVPPVVDGITSILSGTSGTFDSLRERVTPLLARLLGDRFDFENADYTTLAGWTRDILEWLGGSATRLGRGLGAVGESVSLVLLTPVVLFYLLADLDRIRGAVLGLIPERERGDVETFLDELNDRIASYFRGQLTVSVVAGLLTGVGLDIAGVPHALSIGVATAAFNLVPIVGFWLGFALAILGAAAGGALWPKLGWVALIYLGVQQLTDNVLAPRIVGQSVGIHPAAMLFSIIFFGTLFGFVGVLAAVPLAVVTRMLSSRLLDRYRRNVLDASPSALDAPSVE